MPMTLDDDFTFGIDTDGVTAVVFDFQNEDPVAVDDDNVDLVGILLALVTIRVGQVDGCKYLIFIKNVSYLTFALFTFDVDADAVVKLLDLLVEGLVIVTVQAPVNLVEK